MNEFCVLQGNLCDGPSLAHRSVGVSVCVCVIVEPHNSASMSRIRAQAPQGGKKTC